GRRWRRDLLFGRFARQPRRRVCRAPATFPCRTGLRLRDQGRRRPAGSCDMTVRRVMPILTVSDIEASGDAFVRVLGLREVMNHGWIVTLADDEHRHQLSLMTKD